MVKDGNPQKNLVDSILIPFVADADTDFADS